jgi:hypothetical protein
VICYHPQDLDRTVERRKERGSPERHHGEVPAILEFIGEAVSAIVELREDDNDVQFEVAKTMVKRRP